ncbi:hypothetical protein FRAHR75_320026 [Frankia sp. Hr75.2]|nr:hypothetical protein FRAHR75_320026 [Frankia sp. Hr75.2]
MSPKRQPAGRAGKCCRWSDDQDTGEVLRWLAGVPYAPRGASDPGPATAKRIFPPTKIEQSIKARPEQG